MRRKKPLYKQKTFWTALMLAGTVLLPAFVKVSPQQLEAIRVMLVALMVIFLRQGVAK